VKRIRELLALFLHPYRRLYLTGPGWIFSAIAVSMGLIALNTGHNLFHLIFGFLLSTVIVSGLLSERVLRGIHVRRHFPSDVTARVDFAVIVEIKNPHPRKTVYAVGVSDAGDFFSRRLLGEIPSLRPGELKSLSYFARAERRGLYRFGAVHLSTRFPFGFFEKVRVVPLEDSLVAYPAEREVAELAASLAGRERPGVRKQRFGEEFLGLRPARSGDDHRLIHWRTSARTGQWMVKEFVEELKQPRPLFFDSRGTPGEHFERLIESVASLLRLLTAKGMSLNFATWEKYLGRIESPEEMKTALRHLALMAPGTDACGTGFETWRIDAHREGGGIFVEGELPPPAPLPGCDVVRL
jgi:uncharacterized protein (DUF58 family)